MRLTDLSKEELIEKFKKNQSILWKYRYRHKQVMDSVKSKRTSWAKAKGLEMKRMNKLRIREQVNKLIKEYKDRVSVMDGMIMYATISQYAKKIKINPKELAYLVLLNVVDSINPKDCYKFGFEKRTPICRNWLNRLVSIELAEEIEDRYMASVKGKHIFDVFKKYHKEASVTLIKKGDKHRKDYKW